MGAFSLGPVYSLLKSHTVLTVGQFATVNLFGLTAGLWWKPFSVTFTLAHNN